jgi:hypothetical protein
MQIDEIVKITRQRVADLVHQREQDDGAHLFIGDERREHIRWPFPGAVELAPVGDDGRKRWFATCGNLSFGGLGVMTDHYFEPGTVIEISCHFPESSMFGRAVVRHCRPARQGYLMGVQFLFDE